MPNVADLGRAVKQAHPEYADVPDVELGRAVKQAHPEYSDVEDVVTAGKGSTGFRLKGTQDRPEQHPWLTAATAAELGGPILGEGAALLPLGELGAAARQGSLAAHAAPPAFNPYAAITALPGIEALSERLGLPRGVAAAIDLAATYAPKGIAFARGAARYLRQKPYGPEFELTPPPGPLRGPLWSGPQPEPPAGPGPVEPITPITPIRGKQTTIDLQPAARTPGWSGMPAPEPAALPEVSPIRPTSTRRTPPSAVPPPIKPVGSPQAAPPAAAAPVSTPAPPAAPAPAPAAAGGITPIDVPFGEPTVVPPTTLPSQDWRFEDARDMARLLNQHGIDPRTMGPDEWKIAAPALKRNLGVPNDRAAQLVRQEWNKLQPRAQ